MCAILGLNPERVATSLSASAHRLDGIVWATSPHHHEDQGACCRP